jgi:hypothetical protein
MKTETAALDDVVTTSGVVLRTFQSVTSGKFLSQGQPVIVNKGKHVHLFYSHTYQGGATAAVEHVPLSWSVDSIHHKRSHMQML